jgi:hypothetical protein
MRRITAITTVLLVGLTVTGCSAMSGSSYESAPAVVAPEAQSDAVAGDSGSLADEDTSADRAVITTGTMTVTAEDPIDAAGQAATIVEGAGGHIDARTQQAPIDGDKGSATVTLRIPAAQLTAVLDRLKALGEVEDLALTSSDVTRETQDLDARIAASQASVTRLLELLEKSETTSDLIELETAIAQRQGDLESMQAQRRALGDQVELSTIDVSFISVADAPVDEPDTFVTGLTAGWNALVAFGSGLLVVLGVALPWLVPLAIIAGVVVLVIRRRRTRKLS